MSLVTLKRFLSPTEDELGYRKVIALLLSGITDHGVSADAIELQNFRGEMESILAAANDDCRLDQLFVSAGAAIHALESYNARTTRFMRRQGAELQNMISMLTQTVISISGGNERAIGVLNEIKQELQRAAAIEDVEKLKVRLGECLEKVCDEASRQKSEAASVVLELQRNLDSARACAPDPDIDAVTRLPNESVARVAFADALKTPGRKYIVTMVVDRLQPINARFGNAVGDEVLRSWQNHVETNVIQPGDKLFRWSGPTLVVLMSRPDSIDHVRGTLRRPLDKRIENEFDVGGRSALIPISVAWSVIALIPPAANVSTFLNKFVAAQSPRDYC